MKRPPSIPALITATSLALVFALVLASCAHVRAAGKGASTKPAPDDANAAAGDDDTVADYVEYRSIPELSQIQISTGIVRGKSAVERLKKGCEEFAKRGIYPCVDTSSPKVYRRSETMDGHKIDMVLTIDPPPPGQKKKKKDQDNGGGDEDEPSWIRHVVVRIDGHKKFNCSIGDSPTDELVVYGLSIYPEDGTVDAAASDVDGYELTLPDDATKMDSSTVITDDIFEDEGSMDQTPDERPQPVKVMFPMTGKNAHVFRAAGVSPASAPNMHGRDVRGTRGGTPLECPKRCLVVSLAPHA
jgi:hypothetical protein